MIRVEVHKDDPKNPHHPQKIVQKLRETLVGLNLAEEQCEFFAVRNGPEYVQTGKTAPFIRLVVTPDDSVAIIVRAIRRFFEELELYKIDIQTMPISIPAGEIKGRWYDPSDPLRAIKHAERKEGARG